MLIGIFDFFANLIVLFINALIICFVIMLFMLCFVSIRKVYINRLSNEKKEELEVKSNQKFINYAEFLINDLASKNVFTRLSVNEFIVSMDKENKMGIRFSSLIHNDVEEISETLSSIGMNDARFNYSIQGFSLLISEQKIPDREFPKASIKFGKAYIISETDSVSSLYECSAKGSFKHLKESFEECGYSIERYVDKKISISAQVYQNTIRYLVCSDIVLIPKEERKDILAFMSEHKSFSNMCFINGRYFAATYKILEGGAPVEKDRIYIPQKITWEIGNFEDIFKVSVYSDRELVYQNCEFENEMKNLWSVISTLQIRRSVFEHLFKLLDKEILLSEKSNMNIEELILEQISSLKIVLFDKDKEIKEEFIENFKANIEDIIYALEEAS